MEFQLNKDNFETEIQKVSLGDICYFIPSTLDKNSINYNEFLINFQLKQLGCDAELDMGYHKEKLRLEFIPKKSETSFGQIFRINLNHVFEQTTKQTSPSTSNSTLKYENRSNTQLSLKKGDNVELTTGETGKIVKYPSNAEINIELQNGAIKIVNKTEIKCKCEE